MFAALPVGRARPRRANHSFEAVVFDFWWGEIEGLEGAWQTLTQCRCSVIPTRPPLCPVSMSDVYANSADLHRCLAAPNLPLLSLYITSLLIYTKMDHNALVVEVVKSRRKSLLHLGLGFWYR